MRFFKTITVLVLLLCTVPLVRAQQSEEQLPADTTQVAFPEDAHMPGRHLEVPNDFVKIVVKLKV